MTALTVDMALRICGIARPRAETLQNIESVIAGLDVWGYANLGLGRPHRLAHYIAQLAHETGRFRWDSEIWGPTTAQARYDTRTDLGNTAAADGDGRAFRGRGPIMITGRANYTLFREWCRAQVSADAPDFVAEPEKVLTDPWEGLCPLWYWQMRNLNRYADLGDIETLTRRINGGLNGYADRVDLYARAALLLTGYGSADVQAFQADHSLVVDGIVGPQTRAALHAALQGELPPMGRAA